MLQQIVLVHEMLEIKMKYNGVSPMLKDSQCS